MFKCWSQYKLAKLTGVRQSKISRIETGAEGLPSDATKAMSLATALGLDVETLVEMNKRELQGRAMSPALMKSMTANLEKANEARVASGAMVADLAAPTVHRSGAKTTAVDDLLTALSELDRLHKATGLALPRVYDCVSTAIS